MNTKKMKFFGISLILAGMLIIFYSIFYVSSKVVFWPMNIGFTVLTVGLGFLGIGNYPF